MQLSVVILARTDREDLFRMTLRCIESLYASENFRPEVILIESNKDYHQSGFVYPAEVKIIVPQEAFNFHRFLNIGIEAASGEFIALCNNDLLFHRNWFGAMLQIAEKHPDIWSFSPTGSQPKENQSGKFTIGHRAMIHLMGWCFVVRRGIFKTIGPLDETFDFYYADNDYGMTLRYYNLKHALVCGSYVEHLERQSEPKKTATPEERAFAKKYKIPAFLKDPAYDWVFDSEKYLSGILKYHGKWGSPKWLYRKNKLADWLLRHNMGALNKLFLKIKL